ncbi:MAG: NUDIX hydrolase [Anaerolineae bacterium]|nr:NUDIX hydrolase [Anaerolineae bacterium]
MVTKRQLAEWIKRIPRLWVLAHRVYRQFQPWRTIGAVGVVVNTEGKVLIVEHVFHPTYPWGLPGGWMGRHENPDETVQREVLEETGLHVKVIRPLLVEHTPYLPRHIDLSYLCLLEDTSPEIHLSSELLSYRWLSFDELAEMPRFHQRTFAAAKEAWHSLNASTPHS